MLLTPGIGNPYNPCWVLASWTSKCFDLICLNKDNSKVKWPNNSNPRMFGSYIPHLSLYFEARFRKKNHSSEPLQCDAFGSSSWDVPNSNNKNQFVGTNALSSHGWSTIKCWLLMAGIASNAGQSWLIPKDNKQPTATNTTVNDKTENNKTWMWSHDC